MVAFPSFATSLTWLHVKHVNGAVLLTLTRPAVWEDDEVHRAGAEMLGLIERLGKRRFVLDLSGVHALSSGMVGKLIACYKRARQSGGEFVLCSLTPELAERLDGMRLNKLFPICATEEEAIPVGSA